MSSATMTMRIALLLIVSVGAGFGIGHLPRRSQFAAVLAAICLVVLLMTSACATLPTVCAGSHSFAISFSTARATPDPILCRRPVRHQVRR
jgi:hypothetical protein